MLPLSFLFAAIMMQHAAVSVSGTDQGLKQIFELTNMPQELVKYFIEECEIPHTSEFLSHVAATTFETELKSIVEERFPARAAEGEGENLVPAFTRDKQRMYVARARSAYKLATEVLNKNKIEQEQATKPEELSSDLERPLDNKVIESLDQVWMDTYNFKFISHMRPAPQFRNRIFRELKMHTTRLIPVEKARSVEENRILQEPLQIYVGSSGGSEGGKLLFETQKKSSRVVNNVFDYMTALRIIMNTYAYCGSHKVTSTEDAGKQVTYFPYESALGYVDEVTIALQHIQLRDEPQKLSWLRKRDEATRTEMVALINDGWSGGEALTKSWSKLAHMWIMRDHMGVSAATEPEMVSQDYPPVKRQRTDSGKGGKGKGKGKKQNQQKVRLASVDDKKRKICGKFNGGGCTPQERDCPQGGRHVCSVMTSENAICGDSRHGASGHRSW